MCREEGLDLGISQKLLFAGLSNIFVLPNFFQR